MSSQQDLAANREVFRSGGSFVLWWVWVVIAIVALIDLAIQAHNHSALGMAVLRERYAVRGVIATTYNQPAVARLPERATQVPHGAVTSVPVG